VNNVSAVEDDLHAMWSELCATEKPSSLILPNNHYLVRIYVVPCNE